ncbi:MAG: phosphatase PAP2 family protein [Acidobacteria bacterium]|nr:phosphatase PAP2 family protein [Acidobacteriota bacterium]
MYFTRTEVAQAAGGFFERLDESEVVLVERAVGFARRWKLTPFARLVTKLGNGWLYPIAAMALLLTWSAATIRTIAAAGISIGIAFTIYPALKRAFARHRPCHFAPHLRDPLQPLDHYSCPSGHAMTAAAFGVPILFVASAATAPIVIAGLLLMSWSRVALGHHYVTDIVAGSMLGGAIATGVALLIL